MESPQEQQQKLWYRKVLFVVQLAVLIAIMITSIVNIILKTGNLPLWTALLGSSLGFILPTPNVRANKSEALIHQGSYASSISNQNQKLYIKQ